MSVLVAGPTGASARAPVTSQTRIAVPISAALSATMLGGASVPVSVRVAPSRQSSQVELQLRTTAGWKRSASAVLASGGKSLSLEWSTPPPGVSVIVRVVLLRHGHVAAVTRSRRVRLVRQFVNARPRASTVQLSAHQVQAVAGDATAIQTVTLSPQAQRPHVGGILEVPAGSVSAPDGVLGIVTAVHQAAGGVAVTTRPATLDDAYSTYQAGFSGTLGDLGAATASSARAHAAAVQLLHVPGKEQLSCQGSGAGPTISFDTDFSKIHFTLLLDQYVPSLLFSLIGSAPTTIDLAATGAISCVYNGPLALRIPVPGTPLEVILKPALAFGVTAAGGARISVTPRVVLGFFRGRNLASSDTHDIKFGAPAVKPFGELKASAFAGAEADLSLAGRVGVGARLGPNLDVTGQLHATRCVTIDAALKTELSAHADVFVKHWDFALLSGEFFKHELYNDCDAGGPGPGPGPGPQPATVTVTNPGSQTSTAGTAVNLQMLASDSDGGQLTFSATGLPIGLTINRMKGLITGTPTAAGSSTASVSAADASGASGGTQFNWTINPRGGTGAGATAIADGAAQSCALFSTGDVECWGFNGYGGLGNGTTTDSSSPVAVSGITNATTIAASEFHSCALVATGGIECWGDNGYGQLGDGTTIDRSTPVAVGGITNATAIATGDRHSCALLSTGGVECWGYNSFGSLGNGTATGPVSCIGGPCSTTPVQVSGITNATAIATGQDHSCALLSSGGIACWGLNDNGELGNGTTGPDNCSGHPCSTSPVAVSGITNAIAITANYHHSCALVATGGVDCWGNNSFGELGNGTVTDSSAPLAVSGITTATAITTGAYHSCALLTTASLDCWGRNQDGQLGDGTITNSSTPVAVAGITTATALTAGAAHSCALLATGGVDCWGNNNNGELGSGTTANSPTAVAVNGIP